LTKPKSVRSRRKAGETLRREILGRYELNPAEMAILSQACALINVLDRLNQEVAAQSTFVAKGSRGQPVVSALLDAQRRHAEALARLLEALALPASGEEQGEPSASVRARRAAMVRWAKEVH
jgi:hypothetical protein